MSDRGLIDRPMPSSFDEDDEFRNETFVQKLVRRVTKEPLVPIGMVLTIGAFVQAYRAMRTGNHHRVQTMFRARVAFQGLTVLAMVGGGMYYQADRHREREFWKRQREEEAEDKKQRWLHELEVRDEEEKALQANLDKRRKRAAERQANAAAEKRDGVDTYGQVEHVRTETKGSEQAEGASDAPREIIGEVEKKQGTGFLGSWLGGGSK